MKIKSYIVNSFTTEIAQGNPAGVVILDKWLPDTLLINIAKDIGKSETAFIIKNDNNFNIRWFTPVKEMAICGHATMAAFKVINKIYNLNKVNFKSKSGVLSCFIDKNGLISMNFPMDNYEKVEIENEVLDFFNLNSCKKFIYGEYTNKLVIILDDDTDLLDIKPNFYKMHQYSGKYTKGIGLCKRVDNKKIVTRYFNPWAGVDEDFVTGSVHTLLFPYWNDILDIVEITAYQLSSRPGSLKLNKIDNKRMEISGSALIVFEGFFYI